MLAEYLVNYEDTLNLPTLSKPQDDARDVLLNEFDRLEQEVEWLREATRWIPVEERLPEQGDVILAVSRIGKVEIRHTDYYTDINTLALYNSHWRALPEPPEVE